MARGTATPVPAAQPRVRRGYFECRYGQLHVHNAIPPGGGFEEGTSLLCLHGTPLSGRLFDRFLPLAGQDRSVYAPDTPGFGGSDAPPARPVIADYAGAIGDFLDSMRFRQIDVFGYQVGAVLAAELALARPTQIRRVVLASVPLLTEAEREVFEQAQSAAALQPDGSDLASEWQRVRESYGPGTPIDTVATAFVEKLQNRTPSAWSAAAALQYPLRERLGHISQPVLVLRPKDSLWEATLRVRECLPRMRLVDLPEQGLALLQAAPRAALEAMRAFL